jgi:hypothetical protein
LTAREHHVFLAFKIQTPGKYPEEYLPRLQHGESLKTKERYKKFSITIGMRLKIFNTPNYICLWLI